MLSPAERNVALWPPGLETVGVLHLTGSEVSSPALGGQAKTRAYALVGSQATLAGLAERFSELVLQPLVAPLPDSDPGKRLPDVPSTALALERMAMTTVSGTERFVADWRTGTLFPLPMELGAAGWVVYLSELQANAVGPPNLLAPDPSTVPADDLVGPTAIAPTVVDKKKGTRKAIPEEPSVLSDAVAELVAARTVGQVAIALAHDLLDNPSATCLRVVEALLQIEERTFADGGSFASALAAQLLPPQLEVLAWTTAGTVVLRRLWSRLPPADPMYEPVSQALQLVVQSPAAQGSPRRYFAPQQRSPGAGFREPPLTAEQADHGSGTQREVAGIALGRRTTYGWDSYDSWSGPSAAGVVGLARFDRAHGDEVPWPSWASAKQTAVRRHVVVAIGPNEGQVDAVRLADSALLSLGLQQWSFHTNEECTVLLEQLGQRSPDHFDVFFGVYDLGLALCTADGKVDAALDVIPSGPDRTASFAEVQAANPHAFTGVARNQDRDYYPTFVTVLETRPDSDPLVLDTASKSGSADTPRFEFFGWDFLKDKKGRPTNAKAASPAWAARCTVALQSCLPLQECELGVGVFRFTRILDDAAVWGRDWSVRLSGSDPVGGLAGAPRAAPTGLRVGEACPADHTVPELFGSQFAAALLLDAHINVPAVQKAAIMRSWQRAVDACTADGTPIHVGDTEVLSEDFLQRFAVSYSALRGYKETGGGKFSTMPDRSFRIAFEHDFALSPIGGTFAGWE